MDINDLYVVTDKSPVAIYLQTDVKEFSPFSIVCKTYLTEHLDPAINKFAVGQVVLFNVVDRILRVISADSPQKLSAEFDDTLEKISARPDRKLIYLGRRCGEG